MLLQTNSYIVAPDKRAEHARLLRRFRDVLRRLGCPDLQVYEQVAAEWRGEPTGRVVQIMRFRDRHHHQAVQAAERADPEAQALIARFCELVDLAQQRASGLFATSCYQGILPDQTQAVGAQPHADGPNGGAEDAADGGYKPAEGI